MLLITTATHFKIGFKTWDFNSFSAFNDGKISLYTDVLFSQKVVEGENENIKPRDMSVNASRSHLRTLKIFREKNKTSVDRLWQNQYDQEGMRTVGIDGAIICECACLRGGGGGGLELM